MANLLLQMEDVLKLLKTVIDSETGKHLPSKNKNILDETLQTTEELFSRLKDINEAIIDLTNIKDNRKNWSENLEFWNNLPSGAIRAGTEQYDQLKEHSSTIQDFYKASIDISEIIKFDKTEMDLANDMVRDFQRIERSWSDFKKALNRGRYEFETIIRHYSNIRELFGILKKHKVIYDYEIGIFVIKENKWDVLDVKKAQFIRNPNTKLKFIYTLNPDYENFITGNWFNAYVYQALSEQFKRLDVDYEIYPLVSYSSTVSARLSRGEIDVLARIGKKFLFVECKSGFLFNERSNQIKEIIESREKVGEICDATRISDYGFMLVYNSIANEPARINNAFENTDIMTIEITDLQGKVIDFVRNLNI
jgi:hypothetical protein